MKILILNPILYTAQKSIIPPMDSIKDCMIYNLSLGFKELGHSVTLIAASEYKPKNEEKYDFKVIFIKSNLKKIFSPSVLPLQLSLITFLHKKRKYFDLIISSEVFSFSSLFASLIMPNKTVIWHELALHPQKMKSIPSHIWYNIIVQLFLREITIIPRSETAKIFISKYSKKISNRIIEHGVNLHKFNFSKEKLNQFIVASQLIPRKNIESIIFLFENFIQDNAYSEFKLLIVGKGELEDQLKNIVNKKHLNDSIKFLGFKRHKELNILLSKSMGLLINTLQDNNMVSIPESIVSGTPILCNLVPTNSKLINKYQLGIAKLKWDENDMKKIVLENNFYVDNCISYRNELSTMTIAQKFIDCYKCKINSNK